MEKIYGERLYVTQSAKQILGGTYAAIPSNTNAVFMRTLRHVWLTIDSNYKKHKYKPARRAKETYELFDQLEEEELLNSKFTKKISCKDKCSHCCYIHVTITPDEAELLTIKAKEVGVDVNALEKQSGYNDADKWLTIPYKDRKCVFLSDEGRCKIYEDRPLSCRNYRVISKVEDCNTDGRSIVVSQLLLSLTEWVQCVAISMNGGKQESLPDGIRKRL